jgi:glycine cleavage system regulatory protein
MYSVLVLTISGVDRAGLVERLADVVAAHGGNWTHSRMAHLAGRFVGLLELTVPSSNHTDLEMALRMIKDLDVMIATGELSSPPTLRLFDLEIVGTDRPGIVREVFKALAAAGVNVEELSTRTVSAPDSGVTLFEAQARLGCCPAVDQEQVRTALEEIAQDIMVDIRLLD